MDSKKERLYKEHLSHKFSKEEEVYLNTDVPTENEDFLDMFYKNVRVVFRYMPPEKKRNFYPGADAEIEIKGIIYDDTYYLRKELPNGLNDWLWEHLWDNRPDSHKNIP